MNNTVYNLNDLDDDYEDIDVVQEQRELQERVETAVAIHGEPTQELIEEMKAMLVRLERRKEQLKEERAGFNALAAALRPGENLGQLLDWGKAQGLTTMQEIFDARAAEKEVAEWSA